MKTLTQQLVVLVDKDLFNRVKNKISKMKPKKSRGDVVRTLLEAWVSGEINNVSKKII